MPAPAGIVNWWQGEENASDFQLKNHGVAQGSVLYSPGRVGRCFTFDGIDSSVQVAGPTITNIDGFSFVAWVKWAGLSAAAGARVQTIFHLGQAGSGVGLIIPEFAETTPNPGLLPSVGKLVVHFSGSRYVPSEIELPADRWMHLALTRTGATTRLYLSGTKVFEETGSGPIPAAAYAARISDIRAYSFSGSIDEVSLFNRALSDPEIRTLWNADATGMTRVPYLEDISTAGGQRLRLTVKSPTGRTLILSHCAQLASPWDPVAAVPNSSGREVVEIYQVPGLPVGFYRGSTD